MTTNAEGFVNVTEGAGKKLHVVTNTIGANDVNDEIVRLGDQYLASYVVAPAAVSVATANDHLLQIMAGASLKVWIRRIRVWQVALATTAAYGVWEVRRLSTAGTGGTARTVAEVDSSDTAAGATAMTLPTAKGTEGAVLYQGTMVYTQTVGATPGKDSLLLDLDFDKNPRMKPPRIPSGTTNGLAFKHVTAIAAATVCVHVELTEQSF